MNKINLPPGSSKWPFDSPNGSHLAFERSLKTPQKGVTGKNLARFNQNPARRACESINFIRSAMSL